VGIFAYIIHDDPDVLASAIDITLQRFAEYHNLQAPSADEQESSRQKGS